MLSGWQLIEERVAGIARASYVWSPVYVDAMIARDRDTDANGSLDERLYPTHDANFNVTGLVSSSGSVVERNAYDAFGAVSVYSGSFTTLANTAYSWVFYHQGGRAISLSGQMYFRNREYSTTMGRWATIDPIGYNSGDISYYRYESNSSVNRSDSLGLTDQVIIKPIKPQKETEKQGGLEIEFQSDKQHSVRFLQFISIRAKISCQSFRSCKLIESWYEDLNHKHGDATVRIGGGRQPWWQVDNNGAIQPYYKSTELPAIPGVTSDSINRHYTIDMPIITVEIKKEVEKLTKQYEKNLSARYPAEGGISCRVEVTATFHTYVIVDGKVFEHIEWETHSDRTMPKVISRNQDELDRKFKSILRKDFPNATE